jgi:hypothetical protein
MEINNYPHTTVDLLVEDLEECCSGTVNFAFMSRNNLWYVQYICQHGWFSIESPQSRGLTHSLYLLYAKTAAKHAEFEKLNSSSVQRGPDVV